MAPQQKTLFVTGGSGGIGAAIVEIASKSGYLVVAPLRNQLNLSDSQSVESYLQMSSDLIPDAVILAAGTNNPQELSSLDTSNWRHTLEVNLTSQFRIMQVLGLKMASLRRGRILAISSCYGSRSRIGRIAYSASKAALNAVVSGVALELAPQNVLVNGLAPGFVSTELTYRNNDAAAIQALKSRIPLARLASPEEIAQTALYLVGDDNTYITGQVISVDGGFLCQ